MVTNIQRTWILEFLLRQPATDDNHIKRLLPILQPSTHTSRLTKTLLLRRISSDVDKGLVSGKIAEALELIRQIDDSAGTPLLDSLMDAYRAVAFHCICNLLRDSDDNPHNNNNFDQHSKIWRERVLGMHNGEHVSLDLYLPKGGGGGDSALESVKLFLAEATAQMGPPFLVLAAETALRSNTTMESIVADNDQVGVAAQEESDVPPKKGKTVLTPEFRQVREALKLSMVDLRDVVRDPLPDALAMADHISRDMEKDGVNHAAPSTFNQNEEEQGVTNVPSTGNQSEADVDKIVDKECQVVHAKEGNTRNSWPSLMERNNTARTLEWDESPSPSHPHLPSPHAMNVSPLNQQVVVVRNNAGKRRKKMWSSLEEQTLIDAVKEYGRGNWTRILAEYREIFDERTPGDLKDKWRNLTK